MNGNVGQILSSLSSSSQYRLAGVKSLRGKVTSEARGQYPLPALYSVSKGGRLLRGEKSTQLKLTSALFIAASKCYVTSCVGALSTPLSTSRDEPLSLQ